jgi:hypothetical protein
MTDKIIYKWGPVNFEKSLYRGKAIHIDHQNGEVFIWAEAEITPTGPFPYRAVKLHPTGVTYEGGHLGTVVMPSGLVWHVIEIDGDY